MSDDPFNFNPKTQIFIDHTGEWYRPLSGSMTGSSGMERMSDSVILPCLKKEDLVELTSEQCKSLLEAKLVSCRDAVHSSQCKLSSVESMLANIPTK